ncbi:MAG: hypothetical protein R3D05_00735 [Dongiaceae bacterium]
MWEMAKNSIILFLRGRLFQDPRKVVQLAIVGMATTAILLIALGLVGAPLPVAAGVAGLAGGALQPYLFKNLKYR